MTLEIAIVLGVLGATIILFISDLFAPDVVALLAMTALLLTGVLHASDAFSGFGNPAVVTIASIFLVTAGLANTGIAAWIGRRIVRVAGRSESHLQALTMGTAALLSLVMNNIASASVLLPGISGIARQTGINSSRLMLPLAFGTLLGGMATLFTTINILVNDSLRTKGLDPFSLWDFFKVGGILTLAGIGCMLTAGRKLLPNYPMKATGAVRRMPAELARLYHLPDHLFEARILAGSPLDGKTVAESRLRKDYDLNIVGIIRSARIKLAPTGDDILRAGDRLLLEGEEERLAQSEEGLGLIAPPQQSAPQLELADQSIGIIEAVVSPHAGIVGRTLRDMHFREKFGLTVLAVHREGRPIRERISDIPFKFGDALLVQGPWARLRLLRAERDLILLDAPETPDEIARPEKAPWALAAILLMLSLAGFGILSAAAAALLAALIMVLSGSITMDDGYKAVEWRAVVIVGSMLAIGTALDRSGAAALISGSLLRAVGGLGPTALLAGVYLSAMLLAQAMSGVAAPRRDWPNAPTTAAPPKVSA
jgi:di/tricarboxylate transporter